MSKILRELVSRKTLLLLLGLCGAILLAVEVIAAGFLAFYKAQLFDGYAADGIFQLLNPMRRLYAGQFFGRNFNFFHGPFTVLIHYPIFLLFGHDLASTSLAEWIVSPLVGMVILFIFVRILFPGKLYLQLLGTWGLFKFVQWFLPGMLSPENSLLGIRDTGPIIVALCLWYFYKLDKSKFRLNILWDLLVPFLLAFALLTGTEFGVAAVAAALITYFLFQKKKIIFRIIDVARLAIASFVFLVILAALVSAGHPFAVLKYSFVDIPADQFWYFGAPPNNFLTGLSGLFTNSTMLWNYAAFVPLAIIAAVVSLKKMIPRPKAIAIVFLLLSGLFSMLPIFGYFEPVTQTQPMRYYMIFVIILLLSLVPWKKVWKTNKSKLKYLKLKKKYYPVLSILLAVGIFGATTFIVVIRTGSEMTMHLEHEEDLVGSYKVSGSYLTPSWQQTFQTYQIGTLGITNDKDIWSLYTGIYEASLGSFNPSGYDYIIHALGPQERASYLNSFETIKPTAVITLRGGYFQYEPWLENETWPFFEQLYTNYHPQAIDGTTIVWRRNNASWIPATTSNWDGTQKIGAANQSVDTINVPKNTNRKIKYRIYTVGVTYQTSYPLQEIPWIGKTPRYLVTTNGVNTHDAVSLPPYYQSFTFPVLLQTSEPNITLHFYTYGLTAGAHLKIKTVEWKQIYVSPSALHSVYGT